MISTASQNKGNITFFFLFPIAFNQFGEAIKFVMALSCHISGVTCYLVTLLLLTVFLPS